MERTQAIELRKKLMQVVKTQFKPEGVKVHMNVFTHSNILWQGWMYGKTFCGFNISLMTEVKPPIKEDGIFTQYTEHVAEHSKAVCDQLIEAIKRELSIETLEFAEGPPKAHRPEKYMRAVVPEHDIEVRYYTHNDSNGWGRPEVIVTIPFK